MLDRVLFMGDGCERFKAFEEVKEMMDDECNDG